MMNRSDRANQSTDAEQLLLLLGRQVELYRDLERLSVGQRDLIAREDGAALLQLLSDRHRVTRELTGLRGRLAPYADDWKRWRTVLSPSQRRQAEDLLEEVDHCLRRILQQDETDAGLLAARRERTMQHLHSVDAAQRANRAYAAQRTAAVGDAGFGNRLDQTHG